MLRIQEKENHKMGQTPQGPPPPGFWPLHAYGNVNKERAVKITKVDEERPVCWFEDARIPPKKEETKTARFTVEIPNETLVEMSQKMILTMLKAAEEIGKERMGMEILRGIGKKMEEEQEKEEEREQEEKEVRTYPRHG